VAAKRYYIKPLAPDLTIPTFPAIIVIILN